MRLFVAIDLGEEAHRAIAAEQRRIGDALGEVRRSVKWVRAEQAHLTLAFLGEIAEPRVPAIVQTMSAAIRGQPPFAITLAGLGIFPPHGAPRVLWAGIVSGACEVSAIQRVVADRLAATGVQLEDRPFHPHLTLARLRDGRPADRRRIEAVDRTEPIATAAVDAATLYQSRLSSTGSTYTALARAALEP